MDEFYNKHYIAVDDHGYITYGWSDGPNPNMDTIDAICINEHGGYQFRLFPDGEENPMLTDWDGIPHYKWDGTQAALRTEEEMEADRAAIPEPKPSKTVEARLTALEAEAEQAKADREALNILLGGA